MITKEILDEQEKILCECGHRRLQHFVGGPISDCDKCSCKSYRPRGLDAPEPNSYTSVDGEPRLNYREDSKSW